MCYEVTVPSFVEVGSIQALKDANEIPKCTNGAYRIHEVRIRRYVRFYSLKAGVTPVDVFSTVFMMR